MKNRLFPSYVSCNECKNRDTPPTESDLVPIIVPIFFNTPPKNPMTFLRFFFAVLISVAVVQADEPTVDIVALETDIFRDLVTEKRLLPAWAEQLGASKPETLRDAWTKFDVCLRAGKFDAAGDAIRSLWTLKDSFRTGRQLSECIAKRVESTPLLRLYGETFAPLCDDPNRFRRLFGDDDQLEAAQWYGRRLRQTREFFDVPENRKAWNDEVLPYYRPEGAPRYVRAWYHRQTFPTLEKIDEERRRLETLFLKSPDDWDTWSLLFDCIQMHHSTGTRTPIDWQPLFDTIPKRSGYDAWKIGKDLCGEYYYSVAEPFLRKAMDARLSAEELERYRRSKLPVRSEPVPPPPPRRSDAWEQVCFDVEVRDLLALILVECEREDEAKKLIGQADSLRKEHGVPLENFDIMCAKMWLSEQRAPKSELKEAEPRFENDPGYWLQRTQYHRERSETKEQESALRRGLALCLPKDADQASEEGWGGLYSGLSNMLFVSKRYDEFVALFKEQHAAAKENADRRNSLYFYSSMEFVELGREDVVFSMLKADLEENLARLKTASVDEIRRIRLRIGSLVWCISRGGSRGKNFARFIDPKEPIWWNAIDSQEKWDDLKTFDRSLLFCLLFPESEGVSNRKDSWGRPYPKFSETSFKQAETLAVKTDADPSRAWILATILLDHEEAEHSIPLFEKVLASKKPPYGTREKWIEALLKTKDWRKTETHIDLTDEAEAVSFYRRLRDLARETGDGETVERLTKRLANLGVR